MESTVDRLRTYYNVLRDYRGKAITRVLRKTTEEICQEFGLDFTSPGQDDIETDDTLYSQLSDLLIFDYSFNDYKDLVRAEFEKKEDLSSKNFKKWYDNQKGSWLAKSVFPNVFSNVEDIILILTDTIQTQDSRFAQYQASLSSQFFWQYFLALCQEMVQFSNSCAGEKPIIPNRAFNYAKGLYSVLRRHCKESLKHCLKHSTVSKGVCAGCLLPLGVGSECKRSYCGHEFHSRCIETEYGAVSGCPCCMADLENDPTKITNFVNESDCDNLDITVLKRRDKDSCVKLAQSLLEKLKCIAAKLNKPLQDDKSFIGSMGGIGGMGGMHGNNGFMASLSGQYSNLGAYDAHNASTSTHNVSDPCARSVMSIEDSVIGPMGGMHGMHGMSGMSGMSAIGMDGVHSFPPSLQSPWNDLDAQVPPHVPTHVPLQQHHNSHAPLSRSHSRAHAGHAGHEQSHAHNSCGGCANKEVRISELQHLNDSLQRRVQQLEHQVKHLKAVHAAQTAQTLHTLQTAQAQSQALLTVKAELQAAHLKRGSAGSGGGGGGASAAAMKSLNALNSFKSTNSMNSMNSMNSLNSAPVLSGMNGMSIDSNLGQNGGYTNVRGMDSSWRDRMNQNAPYPTDWPMNSPAPRSASSATKSLTNSNNSNNSNNSSNNTINSNNSNNSNNPKITAKTTAPTAAAATASAAKTNVSGGDGVTSMTPVVTRASAPAPGQFGADAAAASGATRGAGSVGAAAAGAAGATSKDFVGRSGGLSSIFEDMRSGSPATVGLQKFEEFEANWMATGDGSGGNGGNFGTITSMGHLGSMGGIGGSSWDSNVSEMMGMSGSAIGTLGNMGNMANMENGWDGSGLMSGASKDVFMETAGEVDKMCEGGNNKDETAFAASVDMSSCMMDISLDAAHAGLSNLNGRNENVNGNGNILFNNNNNNNININSPSSPNSNYFCDMGKNRFAGFSTQFVFE